MYNIRTQFTVRTLWTLQTLINVGLTIEKDKSDFHVLTLSSCRYDMCITHCYFLEVLFEATTSA